MYLLPLQNHRQSPRRGTDSFTDTAYSLQKRSIFTETEWRCVDAEQYARHGASASHCQLLLREARKIYCGYSLYQTLMNNSRFQFPPGGNRRLLNIAEREGFNLTSLVYMVGKWLSDYKLSQLRETLNTIYIVGNPTSCADIFANSLIRMFHCVLTAHLNEFKLDDFIPVRDTTKLIYFPVVQHDLPFRNPFVNEILKGHAFSVPHRGDLVDVGEIKCIVRLNSLPKPDTLPTNPQFHLILRFETESDGISFLPCELVEYLRQIRELEGENDLECKNEFGVLCSTSWLDPPCPTCRLRFDHILSNLAE